MNVEFYGQYVWGYTSLQGVQGLLGELSFFWGLNGDSEG